MAELTTPTTGVRESFLAAMAEAGDERRGAADTRVIGDELHEFGYTWATTPDGFARYVRWLLAQAQQDTPRPEGYVPFTTMWWVQDQEYLGRITIRHHLTPLLRTVGGHIGYDVRPSARRRGHATGMLRAALPLARALGIASALVTCDVDNIASRTAIERNGGRREEGTGDKLRFWVPTG